MQCSEQKPLQNQGNSLNTFHRASSKYWIEGTKLKEQIEQNMSRSDEKQAFYYFCGFTFKETKAGILLKNQMKCEPAVWRRWWRGAQFWEGAFSFHPSWQSAHSQHCFPKILQEQLSVTQPKDVPIKKAAHTRAFSQLSVIVSHHRVSRIWPVLRTAEWVISTANNNVLQAAVLGLLHLVLRPKMSSPVNSLPNLANLLTLLWACCTCAGLGEPLQSAAFTWAPQQTPGPAKTPALSWNQLLFHNGGRILRAFLRYLKLFETAGSAWTLPLSFRKSISTYMLI